MNDIVLDGFVKNFAESRGLSSRPEDYVFEAFAASALLRKYHQSDITDMEESILIGGGEDGGIDAIAIIVNGRLVMAEEDVRFFSDNLRRLDVEFVFVQAKTSASFNAADIGSSGFGVEQFFSVVSNSTPMVRFSDDIQQLVELTRYIYGQGIKMQENPKCYFYYVTTGAWSDQPEPKGRFQDVKERLEQLNLFSDVSATPVDAELLKAIYRELERGIVKEVEFSRTAAFPKIDGVNEAYIGLLSGDEFINLVSTTDGELNRDLFYDNVRDFQGHNFVNKEIHNTLANEQLRNAFPLLNNGITIIARSINRIGDNIRISDFQIVNGCQTTHIVFQNKEFIGSDIFIPCKIVATDDSLVVNEVIKATNYQTVVLPEALESLSLFHRDLEDFYRTQEANKDPADRIYYERRSKQYAMDNIDPSNIVTLTGQIKSFVAMFLNEPHSQHRYYGELLKSYANEHGRLFADHHNPSPYYASGVALIMADKWLNQVQVDRDTRHYKHHMLMAVRVLISGHDVPVLNSRRIPEYSLGIVDALRDPVRAHEEFSRAVNIIRTALARFIANNREGQDEGRRNPPYRLRAFTMQLIEDLRSGEPIDNVVSTGVSDIQVDNIEFGRILWYDDWRKYGFIKRNAGGENIFVHQSELSEVPWHLRVHDTPVRYTVERDPRFDNRDAIKATKVALVQCDQPAAHPKSPMSNTESPATLERCNASDTKSRGDGASG